MVKSDTFFVHTDVTNVLARHVSRRQRSLHALAVRRPSGRVVLLSSPCCVLLAGGTAGRRRGAALFAHACFRCCDKVDRVYMVKFDQRLDAKRAKRQKRQNEEALGDDELSQMGWVAVDADIESIFEQVVRRLSRSRSRQFLPPSVAGLAASATAHDALLCLNLAETFRLKLRTRASHQQEEYNKKKRPRVRLVCLTVDVYAYAIFA